MSFFSHYDFVPSKIEFYNCGTGLVENIKLVRNDKWPLSDNERQLPESEIDNMKCGFMSKIGSIFPMRYGMNYK